MFNVKLLLTVAIIGATAIASGAQANPVAIGVSTGNNPGITTIAVGSGAAGVTAYNTGSYTISLSATGSPILMNPNFGSDTLTVRSSGAGTIHLFATETFDTAIVPSFTIGLSNNPLSDTTVTESVFSADNNSAYGLTTLLATATLAPGATTSASAPFGTLTGTYSITEEYTITFGASGGTVDATILEKANAVPEPMSLSLLGAGLAAVGFVRMRRKA